MLSFGTTSASSNILSNKVESNPKDSNSIEIYLLDLSKSVDKNVVIDGLNSVRNKIADVYGSNGDKYSAAASSYYYWMPVRGVNDRKDFYPLFSSKTDRGLWSIIRNSVGGRANQIKALEKLRSNGGLWSDLIREDNLSGCSKSVASALAEPGLFGNSLLKASNGVCNEAISTRNNYAKMRNAVSDYLSGKLKTSGGSDIFGAISRIDDEANSKAGLGLYKTVNLVFVTDGINNTPSFDLRNTLLESPDKSCRLGESIASKGTVYSNKKFNVVMYGIGEGRSANSTNTELLRTPLKTFWSCYWRQKGVANPEFGQLNQLGIGG